MNKANNREQKEMAEITEKITAVLVELERLNSKVDGVDAKVASLDKHVVQGNGRPSLLERVSVIEKDVEELLGYKRKIIYSIIVSAVSTGGIGALISALT